MFVCLFVCLSVTGSKEHGQKRTQILISFDATIGNPMWGIRIWGPFSTKPHWSIGNEWKSSFRETRFPDVSRCGKPNPAPNTSKPHWSTGNQWKSSSSEKSYSEISRCGKDESEVHSPRNRIGRLWTNGNRVRRKQDFLGCLNMRNTSSAPEYLENPLVDREPMEIEFAGNMFSWGISMRETRIRRPNTSKTHWSIGNQWKSSEPETYFPGYLDAGNTNLNSADRAVSVAVDINIEKG